MIFKLLFSPVTAPIGGFRFIMEQLLDMAEREMMDEGHLREELLLLQLRLEEGEITEEEYQDKENDIIARMRTARAYREAMNQPKRENID